MHRIFLGGWREIVKNTFEDFVDFCTTEFIEQLFCGPNQRFLIEIKLHPVDELNISQLAQPMSLRVERCSLLKSMS